MVDIKNERDTKIHVLSKVSRILDYLTQRETSASMSKMSQDLNIPRGTLYRLVEALAEEEILVQNNEGYQIGPRLLGWTAEALNNFDIRQIARPFMVKLREEFGLTVSLYIRGQESRICLERIEGRGVLRPAVKIGDSLPVHLCSSGQALVAWLPAAERELILEASQKRYPLSQMIQREEGWWDEIKARGWALALGERDAQLAGVGCAMFDRSGEVVASMAISGSLYQFRDPTMDIESMAQRLLACTGQITRLIGGKHPSPDLVPKFL
jgi:DNA-binding IclR family transcriptional regulator